VPKPLSVALAAVVLPVALLLSGCSAAAPTTTPTSTATEAPVPVDKNLIVQQPSALDATTAETETKRLADAMVALLPADVVQHTEDVSQLVAKTTGSGHYYAVLRGVLLVSNSDPSAYAKAVSRALIAAGWIERTTSDASGNYLTALQSDRGSTPWIVVVGGDSSVVGQPVVSLQLASPDLP
jgi:hypothetical protein